MKKIGILRQELVKKQIGCIELIPGRNDATHLERFVNFFHEKGFVVLLGTEHNAPDMIRLPAIHVAKGPFRLKCSEFHMKDPAWWLRTST